jgi:iron-sulfur cluster insertion protein
MSTEVQIQSADPINFTQAASLKVKELIEEEGDSSLSLRVYITGGGGSGFQYAFAFDNEVKEDDMVITKNQVRLLIDSMSFQYLVGADVDYKDDIEGAYFIIRNPNAKTTCGCGSSFSV